MHPNNFKRGDIVCAQVVFWVSLVLIFVGEFLDGKYDGDLMRRIFTSHWMMAHAWASEPLAFLGILVFMACLFSGLYLAVNARVEEEQE